MKPLCYSATLLSVNECHNPATGGPLPLKLVLDIPSYAAGLAIMRDVANARLPITIRIEALQPSLPKSERVVA